MGENRDQTADKLGGKVEGVEDMEEALQELIILAYKSRRNKTRALQVEAAAASATIFLEQDVLEVRQALALPDHRLEKYFLFKDGPLFEFKKLLQEYGAESRPVDYTPSFNAESFDNEMPTHVAQLEAAPSVRTLVSNLELTDSAASTRSYAKEGPPLSITELFQVPVDRRELHSRIARPDYCGSKEGLDSDTKKAADIVFDDLIKFARQQTENKLVKRYVGLKVHVHWYMKAAEALVAEFPCTATKPTFDFEKPTDVYFVYSKDKSRTMEGLLHQKLEACKQAERKEDRRRKIVANEEPSTSTARPPKRFRATHTKKTTIGVVTQETSNLDDPLVASGMITCLPNREKFLELYKQELIIKNRRLESNILTKCHAIKAYGGQLVSKKKKELTFQTASTPKRDNNCCCWEFSPL